MRAAANETGRIKTNGRRTHESRVGKSVRGCALAAGKFITGNAAPNSKMYLWEGDQQIKSLREILAGVGWGMVRIGITYYWRMIVSNIQENDQFLKLISMHP
jgi:hypothetical protein